MSKGLHLTFGGRVLFGGASKGGCIARQSVEVTSDFLGMIPRYAFSQHKDTEKQASFEVIASPDGTEPGVEVEGWVVVVKKMSKVQLRKSLQEEQAASDSGLK